MMMATTIVAYVQVIVALPLIVHANKNQRLAPATRVVGSLLVLFVGSICAPIYWATQIRPDRSTPTAPGR